MRTSRVFTVLLLLAASSLKLLAAPQFTVSVEVTGIAADAIHSGLCHELRALSDVTVTESTNANYRINISSIAPAISGRPAGFALGIVVSRTVDPAIWSQVIATNEVSLVQKLTADTVTLQLQGVKVIPLTGVKEACQQIIADFDTSVLDKQRQLFAQFQAALTNAPSATAESPSPAPPLNRRQL